MFEIGSSLREARLRKGLDLSAASDATKIRARHLEALEDEQFDVLPGQTYVRGFLKTYADYLGLDGQLYVDEYSSRFWVSEDGDPTRPRRVRVRRRHHGRIEFNMLVFTLVAIAGITALVIAAWNFGGTSSKRSAANERKAPARSAPASKRHLTRLVVRAVKGNSVVEVHAASSEGKIGRLLYRGTLERGESQTFVQRYLWLAVSTPQHVVLALNGGSPLPITGKCPRSIAVTPQQVTSTANCGS
jgi:cytoskeletal protein RodZ